MINITKVPGFLIVDTAWSILHLDLFGIQQGADRFFIVKARIFF